MDVGSKKVIAGAPSNPPPTKNQNKRRTSKPNVLLNLRRQTKLSDKISLKGESPQSDDGAIFL
jgi:hypothetical protein